MNFIIFIFVSFFFKMTISNQIINYEINEKYKLGEESPVYDLYFDGKILYVPEFHKNSISLFRKNGKFLKRLDKINSPHSITVNNKSIFVGSYRLGKIYKIDKKNYKVDHNWELKVKDKLGITSIDTINNSLFIADYKNGNIISVNIKDGKIIKTKNIPDSKLHNLLIHNERIFVLDRQGKQIFVFSEDLNLLEIITLKMPEIDLDPLSITIYNEYFLVTNYKDSKIYSFNKKGQKVSAEFLKNKKSYFNSFPTNIFIHHNLIFICEQSSDMIKSIEIKKKSK